MRCPGLAGQEKYIQSCARLLMSVNNGRKGSLGPKIYQSPSPNLTLPVDGVLRGLLGELQHKVVLHRYEYKTKNGSSSLWWCASTLKETEIGVWRDGSVGKIHLLCKLEELNSDLQYPCKKPGMECLCRYRIAGACSSVASSKRKGSGVQ